MTSNTDKPPAAQRKENALQFAEYDAGMESLLQSISLLRAWAAAPGLFDHISQADRQNIFLTTLELAESPHARLTSLR
ncbi:hypothetical protein [Alcaligenes faecalis]|uniref:hypothetical protein n=1 Tax=Alcaligenes faecalis TaxID=511 RepID=UPI001C9A5B50|nr:hypothetical protein [Alcaligenes faecalis]MBY6310435.1 hypothetical protein [Alcaligenes faecalis]MBY6315920.1 hypothetical protein [Alcaligenes faecalis]MBY6390873.1 hypothetical protein [Alcaligenes faecalis]